MPPKGTTTKLPRTCLNCGTKFLAHPSAIRAGRKYCSRKCSNAARGAGLPRVERSCVECGTAFLVTRFAADHGGKKYCSHICYTAHHFGSSIEDRFWSKVDRRGADDCWEWQAGKFKGGYGAFYFRDTLWKASRVAWTLAHGEIPSDLWVLHKCDNPPCCNPDHLFLGTPYDNSADRDEKGRHYVRFGTKHGQSKLTESDVLEIRQRHAAGGITQQELADEFGVSFQNISWIVNRKSWTHI